ncbi:S8 family peptidase [Streptomyces sp. GESEQ-35]|uniref:S8 family peptidase n=1 Tax=Streptomyces sp. GESEQ-35 TaxID=2812657 RepID=UPI0027E35EFA|nr:S8 family peptidase [Streptomyces sp. GESEQ-35]
MSATALVAGLAVVPAAASGSAASAAQTGTSETLTASDAGTALNWITLVTGDRIAVDGEGEPVSVERPAGRADIPIQIQRVEDHTYAVPADAARLVQEGRVDQRLFDLTTLSEPAYLAQQRDGIQLIVTYQGARPAARQDVRTAGDNELRRSFATLDADAVTTPPEDATATWDALTSEPASAAPYRTTASGIDAVWLDDIRQADLDKSVPQIGAPTAWQSGYDGAGTTIAVLDTGVDQTHPDLAGQEIAEKNFSTSADSKDRYGHGTHVASIAAGTGAKSAGKYTGVAPGAKILDGKVLNDYGSGATSGIIAGMEWAAAQGANVVNLSLGGLDSPGIDPLEEAVNRLSAETDTLFVIAAGNSGVGSGTGTIGSPGSADAALTVGAVDKSDQLASFSSRGPRLGDAAIKPDVTAPGVSIGAAAAPDSTIAKSGTPVADGYVAISGTSMATPHVAGAAAILAQEHPGWTGEQIKSTLTGSTVSGGYTPFQQGSGRIDLARAIDQSVTAEPNSLSFGRQTWPHTDDELLTKRLTYRNEGTEPVTLDLSVAATGPDGKPAPEGVFTVEHPQLTVPAGGEASTTVSADTRAGTLDGAYSAYVTASGGGQTVRTAAVVEREVESYDLTLEHIAKDGTPAKSYQSHYVGVGGLGKGRWGDLGNVTGTDSIRLPKGRYFVSTSFYVFTGSTWTGADVINQANLQLEHDTKVTIDERTAKPVDITPPDPKATALSGYVGAEIKTPEYRTSASWLLSSFKTFTFGTAHLGADANPGELQQRIQATFLNDATASEYHLAYQAAGTRYTDGFVRSPKPDELANISTRLGSPTPGKRAYLLLNADTGNGPTGAAYIVSRSLPYEATVHVNTDNATKWQVDFRRYDIATGLFEAQYVAPYTAYEPGRTYQRAFGIGVFGPHLGTGQGLSRTGDKITGTVPLFADSDGNSIPLTYASARTSLTRNGTEIGTSDDPLTGAASFTVPARSAAYRLTTTATRATGTPVSHKVTASWTFRSQNVAEKTALPMSVVRFAPPLAADSTATAGSTLKIPVTVQGAAAGKHLAALHVYVSYDEGAHWTLRPVIAGQVSVKTPQTGGSVSLRAKAADKRGNTVDQTILRAYTAR